MMVVKLQTHTSFSFSSVSSNTQTQLDVRPALLSKHKNYIKTVIVRFMLRIWTCCGGQFGTS